MLLTCKMVIFAVLFGFQWLNAFEKKRSPLVMTFIPNGLSNPRAKVSATLSNVCEITICFWYRPFGRSGRINTALDYEVEYANPNELRLYFLGETVCLLTTSRGQLHNCFPHSTPLLKWQHTCFVWSSYTGTLHFYKDGQFSEGLVNPDTKRCFSNGGQIFVGADQPYFNVEDFNYLSSAFGEITEMHIWDRRVCPLEIQKLAACNSTLEGNIMSWGKTKMVFADNVEIATDSQFCPCDSS